MKISDSLGNLYTHTMFKKKAYEMPAMKQQQAQEESDEITVAHSVPSKHHGGHHSKHHKSQYGLTFSHLIFAFVNNVSVNDIELSGL